MTPIASLTSSLGRLHAVASVKQRLIALSLLRLALGTIVLMMYALHVGQREFLWGNRGVISFADFVSAMHAQHNFSLYQLSASPLFAVTLFWAGFAATVAFTLGFKTRLATIAFFAFTWSLYARNEYALAGGDNLLILLAFFMMFADCGAYLSLDALSGRRAKRDAPFVAMIHNYAVLAIQIQVCLLYFTSAFYKVQGHMWQDGTALYYVLHTAMFNVSGINPAIYNNAFLVTALTYATIVFQMAFPFLIWNRRIKWLLWMGACSLHLSIAYTMGLVWFSAVMISADVIFFSDANFYGLVTRGAHAWNGMLSGLYRAGATPALAGYRLHVYYDGACPLCRRVMATVCRLDRLGLVEAVSFRDPAFVPPSAVDPAQLAVRMHVRTAQGRVAAGIDAVAALTARLPLLWCALPVIWLSQRAGVGAWLYDAIAARRRILPVGGCTGETCLLPPMSILLHGK